MKNKKIMAIFVIIIAISMIGVGAVMASRDSKNTESTDQPTPQTPEIKRTECASDYENMNLKDVTFKYETNKIEFKTLACMNQKNENSYQSSDKVFEMNFSILDENHQEVLNNLAEEYDEQQIEKTYHIFPYTFNKEGDNSFSLLRVNEVDENDNLLSVTYHFLYPVDGKTFNLEIKHVNDGTILEKDWVMEDGFFEEIANGLKIGNSTNN